MWLIVIIILFLTLIGYFIIPVIMVSKYFNLDINVIEQYTGEEYKMLHRTKVLGTDNYAIILENKKSLDIIIVEDEYFIRNYKPKIN